MILNLMPPINFFSRALTLKRPTGAGSYDANGIWQRPTYADTPIRGAIQPITAQDIEMMPEGERRKQMVKLYTNAEIRVTGDTSQTESDLIDDNGRIYRAIGTYNRFVDGNYYKIVLEYLPEGVPS